MRPTPVTVQSLKGAGFVAALDQSGGSTPSALRHYGIPDSAYGSDAEMFALMHEMRVRVMTAPSFTGAKIIAAILFDYSRAIGGRHRRDCDATVRACPPDLGTRPSANSRTGDFDHESEQSGCTFTSGSRTTSA